MIYFRRFIVCILLLTFAITGIAVNAQAVVAESLFGYLALSDVLPGLFGALGLKKDPDRPQVFDDFVSGFGDYLIKQAPSVSPGLIKNDKDGNPMLEMLWQSVPGTTGQYQSYVDELVLDLAKSYAFSEGVVKDAPFHSGESIGLDLLIPWTYDSPSAYCVYTVKSMESPVYLLKFLLPSSSGFTEFSVRTVSKSPYVLYQSRGVQNVKVSKYDYVDPHGVSHPLYYTSHYLSSSSSTVSEPDTWINTKVSSISSIDAFMGDFLFGFADLPTVKKVIPSQGFVVEYTNRAKESISDLYSHVDTDYQSVVILRPDLIVKPKPTVAPNPSEPPTDPTDPEPEEKPHKYFPYNPRKDVSNATQLDYINNTPTNIPPDTYFPDGSPDPPPSDGGGNSEQQYHDPTHYNMGLEKFFPFCIPFDIYAMFSCLDAEPQTPKFHWEISVPALNETFPIDVDLSNFDTVALWFRRFQVLAFCIGLAWITRDKMIKG